MPFAAEGAGRTLAGRVTVLVGMWLVAAAVAAAGPVNGRVKHQLAVSLEPATHRLIVTDVVTLPTPTANAPVDFVLNAALRLTRSEPAAREIGLGQDVTFFGINGTSEDLARGAGVKRYRVEWPRSAGGRAASPRRARSAGTEARATSVATSATLTITYEGTIDFGLSDPKEQYTRGFRETAGIVGAEGVYLAGNGFWYPTFNRDLLEFSIDVQVPAGWHVISQGNGTSRDERGHARWDSGGAMDEIDLVGGPLQVFRDSAGPVETLVYLHERDEALAAKYLAATAQYLEMYRQLIGPYPYGKFALVENFWETGYGMPTFTLLGKEIIRFPFIINSSYPHEILHNWWGNSVFVDYERGNWCEGLTAYLADHLIQEQRGTGAEYRRATLQKYRDYVKEGRDFPLTAFRSRESASTEAVGYGKALMAYHMLRLSLGDDLFRKSIARFYRDFKGKRASFADFEKTVETVSGRDFSRFFADWVGKAGAPALAVDRVGVEGAVAGGAVDAGGRSTPPQSKNVHWMSGRLRQVQGGEPFTVDVPVVVQTTKGVVRDTVHMTSAEAEFRIATSDPPLALHVDPAFDVFRKLDPRETPPSIGQIFGEPRILAVLPSGASSAEQLAWRELFKGWTSSSHAIEVKLDSEVSELPRDRAVWIAGRTNTWASRLFSSAGVPAGFAVAGDAVAMDGEKMAFAGHTLVVTVRHPQNVEKAIGWLAVDPAAAFAGLGRKLPHYGKYSYLGFEGDEPVNVIKGQWQESDSPLTVRLRPMDASQKAAPVGRSAPLPPLTAENRKPLAELPPVFSQKALVEHVGFLADPAREGRGPGSAGHQAAAQYIADRFKAFGLAPGGDEGGYFQSFTMTVGHPGTAGSSAPQGQPGAGGDRTQVANIVGYIPGTRPEWKGQAVLVTAHYDHLGTGWPDVHKGDEGKVHPGADDNASGVAVLLELARVLAAAEKPPRSIVFVAFTGEEAGLAGSKYYVEHATRFPVEQTIGVINLDTVGRLGDQKVSVLGTGTATEWQHIFRGASFVTGVESRNVAESVQASDQVSFTARRVPAVQIFTGAHADYHRPTDTADKIDATGLVKVAAFVREGVAYLAERAEPLTNTTAAVGGPPSPAGQGQAPPPAANGPATAARRVSFGTVPDFAFEGPGVRVASIVAGSPAQKAGVQAGDVLTAIDGKPIANLQGYSDRLRALAPGQTVSATILRAGKEVTLSVTLAER